MAAAADAAPAAALTLLDLPDAVIFDVSSFLAPASLLSLSRTARPLAALWRGPASDGSALARLLPAWGFGRPLQCAARAALSLPPLPAPSARGALPSAPPAPSAVADWLRTADLLISARTLRRGASALLFNVGRSVIAHAYPPLPGLDGPDDKLADEAAASAWLASVGRSTCRALLAPAPRPGPPPPMHDAALAYAACNFYLRVLGGVAAARRRRAEASPPGYFDAPARRPLAMKREVPALFWVAAVFFRGMLRGHGAFAVPTAAAAWPAARGAGARRRRRRRRRRFAAAAAPARRRRRRAAAPAAHRL
jgi:hypothetical protein